MAKLLLRRRQEWCQLMRQKITSYRKSCKLYRLIPVFFAATAYVLLMIMCAMLLCSTAHGICTRLFRGKMHSDYLNGIEILQGRWHHGEKVGYCYPSGLEKLFVSGTFMSR
jgi:hypothetical protein